MSGDRQRMADWTAGAEAIVYQCCAACGGLQYFRRSFCAICGAPDPVEKCASPACPFRRPAAYTWCASSWTRDLELT